MVRRKQQYLIPFRCIFPRTFRCIVPCLRLLFAAMFSSAATAAAAPPPPAEHFFQASQTSSVQLSPKGGFVSMLLPLPNGGEALAIRDTAAAGKTKILVKTSNQETIIAIHWINENRIGFTIKNLRDEFHSNLDEFASDLDGTRLLHLISGSDKANVDAAGGREVRMLRADFSYYDTVHDGSDDILVEQYEWNDIDKAPATSTLHRLNTRTRKLTPLKAGEVPAGSRYWHTDANGVPRIVRSREKNSCTTSYRKANDDAWTVMDLNDCVTVKFVPLFFDGADRLYVLANHQGYQALFRYDLATMTMAAQPLISVPGFDFNGRPEIDRATKELLGIHLQSDAGTTVWLNAGMKALQAKIDDALPGTINTIHCPQDCVNAPVLLVEANADRQPTTFVMYTPASGKLLGLGSTHPDIQPAQMGKRQFAHYAARDGRQIPVFVTMPAVKSGSPQPAVVLVHGGPNVRGAYWDWDAEAQFLASRGYVVIQPEFRGSDGFGAAHFTAGWKQWGEAMQDDLADAALWAAGKGWADPKRIAIMGASYGGYATLMGLIKHPDIFRCGVEWSGVTDIKLMFNTPQSDLSQNALKYDLRKTIGDPRKDAKKFQRNSPLLRAAELKQPLLMAHGAEDKRVPIIHANLFRDAVKAGNTQVDYIVYNNEAHGWRHEDNRIAFWKRVDSFLAENLKP